MTESKSKGEKIKGSDLMLSTENNFLTRDASEDIAPVLGKILIRCLKKGAILKRKHLEKDWLVHKNQRITI